MLSGHLSYSTPNCRMKRRCAEQKPVPGIKILHTDVPRTDVMIIIDSFLPKTKTCFSQRSEWSVESTVAHVPSVLIGHFWAITEEKSIWTTIQSNENLKLVVKSGPGERAGSDERLLRCPALQVDMFPSDRFLSGRPDSLVQEVKKTQVNFAFRLGRSSANGPATRSVCSCVSAERPSSVVFIPGARRSDA